jgi:hypothetical protein
MRAIGAYDKEEKRDGEERLLLMDERGLRGERGPWEGEALRRSSEGTLGRC